MTFGDEYIKHVTVLENIGMTSIEPVTYNGVEIVPLQFLKAVLPDPSDLGPLTKGKTNIGDIVTGTKAGVQKTYNIHNICDHEKCYEEVDSQAVSYNTGVPAMIGAAMLLKGIWLQPGVWDLEPLEPDAVMVLLTTQDTHRA